MVRVIIKSGFAVACLLAVSVFVPRANAGSVDFSCGAPASNPCTGTVTSSTSGGFTTTGIGVQSSFDGTDMFAVTFTTDSLGTGSISISDSDGDMLSGTIVATAPPSPFGDDETLTFSVNWTTLSAGVQTALGSSSGVGQSTVEFSISSNNVNSADLHLSSGGSGGHGPTPEPSTLLLLGTGLLGVGLGLRRYSLA
ncbi:MAG: PEP-CTERM sorting domain-containing protein [Candidatus Acidiferrales bacterium]